MSIGGEYIESWLDSYSRHFTESTRATNIEIKITVKVLKERKKISKSNTFLYYIKSNFAFDEVYKIHSQYIKNNTEKNPYGSWPPCWAVKF